MMAQSVPATPRKLRIGYLMQADAADMSCVSGPQLHVAAVVKRLQRRGHTVRLLAIQGNDTLYTDDLVHWQPARFGFTRRLPFRLVEKVVRGIQSRLHLPFFRFFDSLRFADACLNELAGYDILYERFATLSYGGVMAGRRLGIPVVYEINGDPNEEYELLNMKLGRLQMAVINWVTELTFRYVAHVVSPSPMWKDLMARRWRIHPDKISFVQNGADYDLLARKRDPESLRAKYGFHGAYVIAFVGGFHPWQGIDVLLRAFARLQPDAPGGCLVIAGDGPERAVLAALAGELGLNGNLVLTGMRSQEEVAEILAAADIAVAPYRGRGETDGLKLLDYMAAGKAIVASAWNKTSRVLTDAETALLVEPGNEEDLARTLLRLLQAPDLRDRLAHNAQQKASCCFTWDNTVDKIETICVQLAGPDRSGQPGDGG